MIVVDIETSGVDFLQCGIWQIGAIDLNCPTDFFLQEAMIDKSDIVEEEALKVIGKTEEALRDRTKQPQKQLLKNFFGWISSKKNKTLVAHNTPFDYGFLVSKASKYRITVPFHHRTFDLHVIAAMKYFEINHQFLLENGKSAMNLSKVMEFCGMHDKRIRLTEGNVEKEGNPHNALEDAKLEAECLWRILYGKKLFDDYIAFNIPSYLIKRQGGFD